MEDPRARLSVGRLATVATAAGTAVPWASAQAMSYREAVLPTSILEQDEDPDAPKPVSFTVKETVCPRRTQLPPEQCDFKEKGVVKQCLGTVTLDQVKDQIDISCNKVSGPSCFELLWGEENFDDV
ncbi:Protegrin-1 [Camelus dromedarius]|uniref:Protegrin-1 n=1 Tax=Camelus dromedarius TaxID=9838 RepID=A0A5N4CYU0_CAMDR|nr:Protegrin-1 [Camelus dromedarius]